jgi:MFS family permease
VSRGDFLNLEILQLLSRDKRRWIYHSSAIVTAMVSLLLFTIRESRPTKLLSEKLERLEEKYHGNLEPRYNPDAVPNGRALAEIVLLRPIRLAVTEPIVIMVSLLNATAWGLLYLFTESLPVVYSLYGWSDTTTSLAFIAIGLGIPFSLLCRLWDVQVSAQRKRQNQDLMPEDRIIGFVIAAPVLAIGLWLFSWTIPPLVHTHWTVSMVGLVCIGFAANEFAYTLNGYLSDSYTIYASSGLTTLAFLRALVSGIMPLFGYPMFSGLGGNIAGSILAAVATLFCVTPFIFLKYGRFLRERSPFARYSAEVNEQYGDR